MSWSCLQACPYCLLLVAASSDASSIEPDDHYQANLEPVRSRPSTRAARALETASKKTTQKNTVGKNKNDASMPVRPRTRRQVSMTGSQSSTVSSQLPSNAIEDEAESATTTEATSQTVVAVVSSESDSEFERLPVKIVKVEKKIAPSAGKRPTTRARSAWK